MIVSFIANESLEVANGGAYNWKGLKDNELRESFSPMNYIQRGTPAFKKANLALFAGGFSTFAILWGTQPLLPDIAKAFHLSPAISSLTQSSSTIALAISLLIIGTLSESFGRKRVMAISLMASSILSVLSGFMPSFGLLIVCRILLGITLAGLPAVAMAYLGEEMEPKSLGMAMGLYISGNSFGGMAGRIISSFVADSYNWHIAIMIIGIISLAVSIIFWLMLPQSSHFNAKDLKLNVFIHSLFRHFQTPGLLYLFLIAFLIMGGFVSLYNYIGFQLIQPPFSLSQTLVGFIFIIYIVGTFSSTWMGVLADQYGKGKMMPLSLIIMLSGALITLNPHLWIKILGIALLTFGFFGGHSIASGWVGKLADYDKAQAASLYLFSYYAGSSIGGTISGTFYSRYGWIGVIAMIVVVVVISVTISIRLGFIEKGHRSME